MAQSRRWWFGACGLDCNRCTIHLRTEEELDYWRQQNADLDKIRCDGCRSDRQSSHWSPKCKILQCCVYDRGLEFCAQCSDFPCQILNEWGATHEHHAKQIEQLTEMKKIGVEKWLSEHSCKEK